MSLFLQPIIDRRLFVNRMGSASFKGRSHERGAALVVILLLLLIVTLLGLAGIRGALLQERMAANAMARSYAFSASEAVLREGEGFASGKPTAPTAGCVAGVCVEPKKILSAWQGATFWDTNSGWKLAQQEVNGIPVKYVIEKYGQKDSACATAELDMSSSCGPSTTDIYRITVRSKAADGAEVILQSLYQVP